MLYFLAFTRRNKILVPHGLTARAVNLCYCHWPCFSWPQIHPRGKNSRFHPVPFRAWWTPSTSLITAFLVVETYTFQRPFRFAVKNKKTLIKNNYAIKLEAAYSLVFVPKCPRLRCGPLFTAVMSWQNIGCMWDREIIFVTLGRKQCAKGIIKAKMVNNPLSVVEIKVDL